jgi:hypothetical protein
MALSDALSPVFSSLYQHLNERAARSILHSVCRLVCPAWDWAQTTEDAKGEPKVLRSNRKHADVIDDPHESTPISGHLVWA